MGMDYKKANLAFFFMIVSTFLIMLYISFWQAFTGRNLSLPMNNALCELMILLPAVAVTWYSGEKFTSVVPFGKISVWTGMLSALYVITLFPLVMFVNAFSQLFVDNVVASISDQVVELPMVLMVISIGIFGPFVEEVVFRGVIFHSFRRTGRIVASMALSAVLFGMMHLNFNQFAYATVMGIMFCLMVEATGSVIPSFIAHAVFNSIEVIAMYASMDEVQNLSGNDDSKVMLIAMLAVLLVASILFTVAALFIVYLMARIEGRQSYMISLLPQKKNEDTESMDMTTMENGGKKQSLFTVPLIIAMAISVCFMIYSAIVMRSI